MNFIWNMQNSKFWNPEKNYFALLLPPKAHNSNEGIMGKIAKYHEILPIEQRNNMTANISF